MASNFKKLEEAYDRLNWLKDQDFNKKEIITIVNHVQGLIQETIVDHTPKPKGKFDLWEYVANDKLRPVLNGIYHDPINKAAIATDAHVLVVDRASFDENLVDKEKGDEMWKGKRPVDKYGKFIDGRFPSYENCIPKKTEEFEKFMLDMDEIASLITKHKTWLKLNGYGKSRYIPTCIYKIKDSYFEIHLLYKFLKATSGEINVSAPNKPGVFWSEERKALVMPMYYEPNKTKEIDGMLLVNVD